MEKKTEGFEQYREIMELFDKLLDEIEGAEFAKLSKFQQRDMKIYAIQLLQTIKEKSE
jgi:hypothetical protein